jgi:FlaA1/EpsC-like NDP-sugar epimerase
LSREIALLFGDKANVSRVNKTRFTMVRFGNVLGRPVRSFRCFTVRSKSGGPLTVTHPKITRYFMTIPEAAQLVIQAGSMGQGGDVFVLDMGEPVKIVELAEKMIHLSGLSVRSERTFRATSPSSSRACVPVRSCMKSCLIGDNVSATPHPMIMSANEDHLPWDVLKGRLTELLDAVELDDYSRVRQLCAKLSAATPLTAKSLTGSTKNVASNPDCFTSCNGHIFDGSRHRLSLGDSFGKLLSQLMSWSVIYAYWLLLLPGFCPSHHCLYRCYCGSRCEAGEQ